MDAIGSVRSRVFILQRIIVHHDVGQLGIRDLQESKEINDHKYTS